MNLLGNAAKYTQPNGRVVLRVKVDERELRIDVEDTGVGIPESDLPHVFDRFYRADDARTRPGSGLGLSIVDQIVTDHGGTVFARNRADGTGAEVGFSLPSTPRT